MRDGSKSALVSSSRIRIGASLGKAPSFIREKRGECPGSAATMGEEEEAQSEMEALLMPASANSRLRSLSESKYSAAIARAAAEWVP